MDYRSPADDCKLLAGAFAQNSQLPEELLFIVFNYIDYPRTAVWALLLVCELYLLPSLASQLINITLPRLSGCYTNFGKFIKVFQRYDKASQARVFGKVPAEEIIRLFHITKKNIIAAVADPVSALMCPADRGLCLLERFNAAVPTD